MQDELDAFVALTREREVHVRFIEFMPLDRRPLGGHGRMVPAAELLSPHRPSRLVAARRPVRSRSGAVLAGPGRAGTIGFIAGVSEHFCMSCNRLRLTADGRLRTCLFSGDEVAVRPLLGEPAILRGAIETAVAGKTYDRCSEALANDRSMSQIGG